MLMHVQVALLPNKLLAEEYNTSVQVLDIHVGDLGPVTGEYPTLWPWHTQHRVQLTPNGPSPQLPLSPSSSTCASSAWTVPATQMVSKQGVKEGTSAHTHE